MSHWNQLVLRGAGHTGEHISLFASTLPGAMTSQIATRSASDPLSETVSLPGFVQLSWT